MRAPPGLMISSEALFSMKSREGLASMVVVAEARAAGLAAAEMRAEAERTRPSAASAGAWSDTCMEPLLLPGSRPRLQAFSLPGSGAGVGVLQAAKSEVAQVGPGNAGM